MIDRARTGGFPWCQELDTYTLDLACTYLKEQLDMAVDAKILKIQTAKIDTDYPLRFDGPSISLPGLSTRELLPLLRGRLLATRARRESRRA